MDEDKKQEQPADNAGEGVQQKAISELDRADQIAERQKRENDKRAELLDREEAILARKAVGGIAEAGQKGEVKMSEEEVKQKGAEDFFEGTQLAEDIKKANEKK